MSFVPLGMRCCFPPRSFSLPLHTPSFWTKWGNVCQHMSPSVNKHFQHVENNNLALCLLHQDVMNRCTCLSLQPCFWQRGDCLNPTTIQPLTSKAEKSKTYKYNCAFFSILASQYKSSTMNLLPPTVGLAFPPLPKITLSQLKRPRWRMFDVSEYAKDMPSANLIR